MLPEQGAVLGVKGGDDALLGDALAATADDEYSSVEDDGGRAAGKFACQMGDQDLTRPVSSETPFCAGPRQEGQSAG